MSSWNDQLLARSRALRPVTTRVTLPSGQIFEEVDGQRRAIEDQSPGYVVDTKPDLEVSWPFRSDVVLKLHRFQVWFQGNCGIGVFLFTDFYSTIN